MPDNVVEGGRVITRQGRLASGDHLRAALRRARDEEGHAFVRAQVWRVAAGGWPLAAGRARPQAENTEREIPRCSAMESAWRLREMHCARDSMARRVAPAAEASAWRSASAATRPCTSAEAAPNWSSGAGYNVER